MRQFIIWRLAAEDENGCLGPGSKVFSFAGKAKEISRLEDRRRGG
jgi:hypothetical protein